MSTRRPLPALAVAVVLALGLLAAGAPALAAPPPEDVCGVCSDHFESGVADADGPDVTVERSRLDVHVRENGSARVVARNTLPKTDAAWVANNTDAVAHALSTNDAGLDESKHALSVRVDDETAVVSYVDETFGYRTFGGVVVADAFTRTPTGWRVNADAFAVHAPGTHVLSTHDRGNTVATWTEDVDTDHVAFAPSHGPVSAAATQLALVVETAPAFLQGATLALFPVVGALAVLFGAVDTAAAVTAGVSARTAGTAAAVGGAAVVLGLVATGAVSLYFMLPGAVPLFTAVTAFAVGAVVLAGARSTQSLALAAVGVPLSAAAVAGLAGGFAHPAVAGWTIGRALAAGCLAAQVGVFTVLGATRDRRSVGGRPWRWFGLALAPAVAVVAAIGPTFLLLLWVPVLLVLAPAAYALGASVGPRLRSV